MSMRCSDAIVRKVPDVFVNAVRMDDALEINLKRARDQFMNYVNALENCGVHVVTLEADEKFPDCPFVEDVAVVIGATALVTRPGHPSRRGEVDAMRNALKALKNGPEVFEMDDETACIDGGDVLFTGSEIFVGESARTNAAGIQCLQKTFPKYPVTSFLIQNSLHLKSLATMCGVGQIAVGGDPEALDTLAKMKSNAKYEYEYIQLDNNAAANVLLVNDYVFIKPAEEIGQNSYNILKKNVKGQVIEIPFSEFYKVDGCLTCCSILLNKGQE